MSTGILIKVIGLISSLDMDPQDRPERMLGWYLLSYNLLDLCPIAEPNLGILHRQTHTLFLNCIKLN